MHGRGSTQRHTFGSSDDFPKTQTGNSDNLSHSPAPSTSGVSGVPGGRTRRTGLLTVTERPPGNYFVVM